MTARRGRLSGRRTAPAQLQPQWRSIRQGFSARLPRSLPRHHPQAKEFYLHSHFFKSSYPHPHGNHHKTTWTLLLLPPPFCAVLPNTSITERRQSRIIEPATSSHRCAKRSDKMWEDLGAVSVRCPALSFLSPAAGVNARLRYLLLVTRSSETSHTFGRDGCVSLLLLKIPQLTRRTAAASTPSSDFFKPRETWFFLFLGFVQV